MKRRLQYDRVCRERLAEDIVPTKAQDLGEGEAITLEFMTQSEVRKAVESGELKHALALSALARVFPIWPMPFAHADP